MSPPKPSFIPSSDIPVPHPLQREWVHDRLLPPSRSTKPARRPRDREPTAELLQRILFFDAFLLLLLLFFFFFVTTTSATILVLLVGQIILNTHFEPLRPLRVPAKHAAEGPLTHDHDNDPEPAKYEPTKQPSCGPHNSIPLFNRIWLRLQRTIFSTATAAGVRRGSHSPTNIPTHNHAQDVPDRPETKEYDSTDFRTSNDYSYAGDGSYNGFAHPMTYRYSDPRLDAEMEGLTRQTRSIGGWRRVEGRAFRTRDGVGGMRRMGQYGNWAGIDREDGKGRPERPVSMMF